VKTIDVLRYIVYFLIIAALFIGMKMVHMIHSGEEIPEMMVTLHSHTLGISFLALLIWSDLRIREKEIKMIAYSGEISLGAVVVGLLLTVIGFSLMLQSNYALGSPLSYTGESIIILGVFGFLVSSIISEVIK